MIKKSFFKTSQNRLVYFELTLKNTNNIVVFLNGLSDSIESWGSVKSFVNERYSTLFIDLVGQGRSLQEELTTADLKDLDFKISIDEQAHVVNEVWRSLNIPNRIKLVGFSYGGGVAIKYASLFPDQIDTLILFLPFMIRLDQAFPIQRLWAGQLGLLKNFDFFKPGINILGDSYQKLIRDYMNMRFSKHIPDPALRKVSMDLTEGIMPFNAFKVLDRLPEKSVHLITVERDTLVPKSLYQETWARIPESKKCTWLNIKDGEHLIFEQAPLYCSQWIETILSPNSAPTSIRSPRLFIGNSYRMEAIETTDTLESKTS